MNRRVVTLLAATTLCVGGVLLMGRDTGSAAAAMDRKSPAPGAEFVLKEDQTLVLGKSERLRLEEQGGHRVLVLENAQGKILRTFLADAAVSRDVSGRVFVRQGGKREAIGTFGKVTLVRSGKRNPGGAKSALMTRSQSLTKSGDLEPIRLEPGQKLVLASGKRIIARGTGNSEVFGVIGDDGVMRWYPLGTELRRDAKGEVLLEVGGKIERMGAFEAYEPAGNVTRLKPIQGKVNQEGQPMSKPTGSGPKPQPPAPKKLAAMQAIHLGGGQKLVLTNGRSIVARGAGASEVFGIVGDDGVMRWYPKGTELRRDAKGGVYLRQDGKTVLLGTAKNNTPGR